MEELLVYMIVYTVHAKTGWQQSSNGAVDPPTHPQDGGYLSQSRLVHDLVRKR